jgi:uncharacterized Zn-binding protein involved in type VI secretion
MSNISTERIKLTPTPGTCKINIIGEKSGTVKIDNEKVFIDKIKFTSNGGIWQNLINCTGKGEINATTNKVIIEGKKVIQETDKGKCSGQGLEPTTGAILPCKCLILQNGANNKVNIK